MSILQLISTRNYISLNKDLIRLLGLEEAIILGELASEFDYWEREDKLEEGYFYSTVENIEANTTLSDHKQRKALKNLKSKNLVDVKVKGIPAKRYIKINEDQVLNLINSQFLKNLRTRNENIEELEVKKLKRNNNITNNNIINNNKERKKESSYDQIINELVSDEEVKKEIIEFIKMRSFIKKPMSDRALKMLINKLNKISSSKEEQIQILEKSIINNWSDIYPIKKDYNKKESINKEKNVDEEWLKGLGV